MVFRTQFTDAANQILDESQKIVNKFNHPQWDREHILIALLDQQQGVAADILREIGADVPRIRDRVRQTLSGLPTLAGCNGAQTCQPLRVSRLLYEADVESKRLQDDYISPEHLLIALTSDPQDPVTHLLAEFGVTKDAVYQGLQKVRGDRRVAAPYSN